ncbi:MAG TPA: hypothetical protein VLF62_01200 [Candidatus Saccharimonadales bacterium]|nr:hypothetical protein [Candidatus Saccharimonadales bacterium]
MQFLRKAALTAAASLLGITLFSFGLTWSLYQVFSTPHQLKTSITSSGLYDSAIAAILKQQSKTAEPGGASSDVPVNRPEVQKIIEQAFPPQLLQSQTEQVIDATYTWLSGDAASLQFSLDFSQAKANLANGLQQYAKQRLSSLPACPANTIPYEGVDVFNATCVPPGADINAIAAKAHDDIMNGDFLKDPTLNASTLKTSDGKPLQEQLREAPGIYRAVTWSVYGGAVLALLLAAAMVFLSVTRRVGVRRVAISSITVGALSAVLGWLSSFAVHQLAHKFTDSQTSNTSLQPQISNLVQSLADDLRNWWVIFGLTCVVLGIAALIALHVTKPKNAIDLRTQGKPHPKSDAPDLIPSDDSKPAMATRHEHVVAPPTENKQPKPRPPAQG